MAVLSCFSSKLTSKGKWLKGASLRAKVLCTRRLLFFSFPFGTCLGATFSPLDCAVVVFRLCLYCVFALSSEPCLLVIPFPFMVCLFSCHSATKAIAKKCGKEVISF